MLTKKNFPFSTRGDILEQLREEAESKNISVNSLINSLLEKHLFYYKLIEKKGMVVIPRRNFQFMLDNVEESVLKENFRRNEFETCNRFLSTRNYLRFDQFIDYFLDGLGVAGGFFDNYSIEKDDSGHTIVLIEHDYNSKWSSIIGSILCEILHESFNYHTQCLYFDKTITIKILEKKL